MELYALPIIGLIVFLSVLMREKGEFSTHISKGVVIGFGFFLLAIGSALIASAYITDVLLGLEEHRDVLQKSLIDSLTTQFNPFLLSGYANVALGAILLAFGITNKRK